MLLVCNWYHEEIRILGEVPGDGISLRLCPECSDKLSDKLRAESAAVVAARIQPVRIDKHATA